MASEIFMPRLGWTMEEGTFGEWVVEDGAQIKAGDILFTVESDKATEEVEAFDGGILRIPPDAPQSGDIVAVGTLMAYVVQADEPFSFERQAAPETASTQDATAALDEMNSPMPVRDSSGESPRARDSAQPAISPRARRVALELGVEWIELSGSGRNGRIVERDVRAAATATEKVRVTPVAQRMAADSGIDLAELARQKGEGRIQREDVEAAIVARTATAATREIQPPPGITAVGRIRRLIAERMAASAQTTAPVTLTTEADATEFVLLREQFKTTFEPRGLSVPSYNDMLVKLTAVALQEHPLLNSTWNEHEIITHRAMHIGLAVDTDDGLRVPVIHDAQAKTVRQITTESASLIARAQEGRLGLDDLQGGTFTITNLGMYNIDAFTPIINLPECAILGVGRILAKPAVVNDQVVPRKLMSLSLTFDHRVVDGGPAARFLDTIRQYVEAPTLWLIA